MRGKTGCRPASSNGVQGASSLPGGSWAMSAARIFSTQQEDQYSDENNQEQPAHTEQDGELSNT